MAGSGDLVVGRSQAERLHGAIPGSTLRVIEGVGHMIHHVRTQQVVEAIEEVIGRSASELGPAGRVAGNKPSTGNAPDAA
jgi:hypothetical protein